MRLATREEIQNIEKNLFANTSVTALDLMEMAGRKMTEKILQLPGIGPEHNLLIVCGPGNNGADGLTVARRLVEAGFSNITLCIASGAPQSELWKIQFEKINKNIPKITWGGNTALFFSKYDLIIDALFGIGLNRPIETPYKSLIEQMNKSKTSIVSLDVPSGLDVNRGIALGAGVKATMTLTCGLAKPGFFIQDGPGLCGRISILKIGFPDEIVKQNANSCFYMREKNVERLIPRRHKTANKSSFGKLLVLAGQSGMEGAAYLVGMAAARTGVGYVTLCTTATDYFKWAPADFLRLDLNKFFYMDLSQYTGVVVGPGFGVNENTLRVLQYLRKFDLKVLVDADAFTVYAENKMGSLPANWLITPHAGEMSRLLGVKAKEIEENRLWAVEEAHKITGANVLLKGFRTMVFNGRSKYIIGAGNSALAKAGTGDVLAGMIGSWIAQGLDVDKAAILGAFQHGRLADLWLSRGYSVRSLMASDLLKRDF